MEPVVILITLIATFSDMPNVNYYSHNPQVLFVKEEMCIDVVTEANDYFLKGAELYARDKFPERQMSTLRLDCMNYSVTPDGGFVPLDYEVLGEWDDDDYNDKPKGMQI
jgi:hypothetical protein